jgi:two-component system sensor kinase FixL
MPAGGVVTASTRAGEHGTVRFSVSDTGKGVHVPDGTDVFEPFVTTKPGGVGLGLYVCRRNVERHGGRIGYDSSAEGTTFWFELPAAD